MIKGVIEAETGAIEFYNEIVERTDDSDPVTNDMVIQILHDEAPPTVRGFPPRVHIRRTRMRSIG